MSDITHIGLDVHKDSIAVAVLRPGTTEVDERVIPNTPEALRRLFRRYEDPSALRACYEAGPTGYDTHRLITSLGIECDVIAPSMIPRRSGVREEVKRDAGSPVSGSGASCSGTASATRVAATRGHSASRHRYAQCDDHSCRDV